MRSRAVRTTRRKDYQTRGHETPNNYGSKAKARHRAMTEQEQRAIYDAGREDVASGVPIHDFEAPVWSDERMHDLTDDCWCNPRIEHVPASRITHRDRSVASA